MQYYNIQPSTKETGHRFALELKDMIEGAPECESSILLSMDMGMFHPELAGKPALFLELPPAMDWVDFQLQENGKYQFKAISALDDDQSNTIEYLVSLMDAENEETLRSCDEISTTFPFGQSVELIEVESYLSGDPILLEYSQKPQWLQNPEEEMEKPEWKYLGAVTGGYYFGKVYAFYNPSTSTLRNVFQCT